MRRWRWLHRSCEANEGFLLRDRDRVESALGRLQRGYDELLSAHQALVASVTAKGQEDTFSKMLTAMWEEIPVKEGEGVFLTPTQAQREGLDTP